MEKQEIVNIANELMGNPSKKQEYRLLNSLVGHNSIKRLTEEQFDTVCTFCKEVSKIREQMFKDLVTENDSEVDAIESIYNVSQRIKDMIEEAAFGELKKNTTDIDVNIEICPLYVLYDLRLVAAHLYSDESRKELLQSCCKRLDLDENENDYVIIANRLIEKLSTMYETFNAAILKKAQEEEA